VLGRTEAFLSQLGDRHAGLRRMLLEVKDGAERALRVQAADRAGE